MAMYQHFFGLQREPFSIAPDPRFLFMSERHREALAHLLFGLQSGGGFVLLTGEVGAGKTTVSRAFLEHMPQNCHVAYVLNPKQTTAELLATICSEFHIPKKRARSIKGHIDALNDYLLTTHAAGENNVLIVDEAQNLSAEVLEQLRLLTNLETQERKLLQIILIGQPELRTLLAQPHLEQLSQRVIARYHLEALSPQDTAQYVAHRLAVAGLATPLPFDAAALKRVHALTQGVPRRINVLCDRALLGAWSAGSPQVDARMVDAAWREISGAPAGALPWWRGPQARMAGAVIAAALVGVLAGAGLLAFITSSGFWGAR
jgi:general secretion pathway protein A